MSNFAFGRMARMIIVGVLGFFLARVVLASQLGLRIPREQHEPIAWVAAIVLAALASRHT